MKFSLASTILIVVIGAAMAFMHQKRLTTLEDDQRSLVKKATDLGISIDLSNSGGDSRITKRQREESGDEAKAMTAELAAFAREMEEREESGSDTDEVTDDRAIDLMGRLMRLDPSQLKTVIAGLRDDKSLPEESRRNMIGFAIMILGEKHPEAALAIYSDSVDLLGDDDIGQHAVASSLRAWASTDPNAALEWIRKNEAAHPDLTDDDGKLNIIAGAALTDPKLAFSLISEMKLEDPAMAIDALVESGTNPTQRTAILAALRDHLATLPDGTERDDILRESLESMGRNLAGEGFETVKSWIADAKLSPQEAGQFAAGLSYFNTKEDTGRWIAWMAQNLPEGDARECADNLIGQWTQQDYLAAGQWLAAAPEGPTKNAAVATYAETVAEYEPQVAVQWALRLPEGAERKATLAAIYQEWPKGDTKAAAEFAREYGVDTEAER